MLFYQDAYLKIYGIGNAENKEYLLLSMKRLNELASVIIEALENEGILAS